MEILPRDFYDRDTLIVARELLGCYLVREWEGKKLAVRITETEAYIGRMDKACHAYQYKRTPRTETLFSKPGISYIYLIYGMYHCLNFVTEPEGEPSAVLLRGLAPVHGLEALCRLRYGKAPDELTAYQRKNFLNGPGKCCQALGLDRRQNGIDLTTGEELFLCTALSDGGLPDQPPRPLTIHTGKRIGIDYAQEAVDFPWRFWIDDKGEYLC